MSDNIHNGIVIEISNSSRLQKEDGGGWGDNMLHPYGRFAFITSG